MASSLETTSVLGESGSDTVSGVFLISSSVSPAFNSSGANSETLSSPGSSFFKIVSSTDLAEIKSPPFSAAGTSLSPALYSFSSGSEV
ncbi:hypothetical protein ACFX13_045676 [Malus domestica]